MSDTRMTIRNLDRAIYRRARIVALENEIPMGELINHSLEFLMKEAVLVEVDVDAIGSPCPDLEYLSDGEPEGTQSN